MSALRILTAALALGCALAFVHVVSVIGFKVPFDPNEGWNAAFTGMVLHGGSPYPAAGSFLVNNYPPLSFYVVAALTGPTGDAIVAGRIVALVGLIAIALGIAQATRQMGGTRLQSAFAALFFTAGLMLTSDYAGMDDPQLLGQAVAMGGLLLALREPRTPRAMVGAALLFVIAFFIKHNLVVLPAALAAWLVLADRRHAPVFILSGIVFLLIGLGLFREIFGVSLFSQIASARSYAFANIWIGLRQWLPWSAIPLAGAVALFVVARHDRHAVFCVLYTAIAVAAGLYFLGGAGVDANARFDADVALALCAGVLVSRLDAPLWRNLTAGLYAIPPLIGLWSLDADWRSTDYWLHPMAEERHAAATEIALIRAARGPVLCETLSLCYWAGKPAEVDVFNIGQAFATGARSDDGLAAAIARRHYVLIEFEQLDPFPLTPKIRQALNADYRTVLDGDDGMFFAPR